MRKKKLRILIAYNDPADAGANDLDYISEVAVKNEADIVYDTLVKMGHNPALMAVSGIEANIAEINDFSPELIFNLCEGFHGQSKHEMHIAALWEILGIPYSGNKPITLGISQNKVLAKNIFMANGIPTPEFEVFDKVPEKTHLGFPLIVKPSNEDASLGISQNSLVTGMDSLRTSASALLEKYREPVLVEKFIEGREFNVSVIGGKPAKALEISEIDFTALDGDTPKITGYESKWLEDHPLYRKTPSVCPAKISPGLKKKLVTTALEVYEVLMGKDYGRVDFRVDARENIFVLEFNPNPDISPGAGFSKSLAASGLNFEHFLKKIIKDNTGF
ncbi:MAG: ATP-grasp domain-containing protein [Victivallales bacterium]